MTEYAMEQPDEDEPDHLAAPMGGYLHGVLERIKNGALKPAPRGNFRWPVPTRGDADG